MIKYYQYDGTIYVYPADYAVPDGMEELTEQGYDTLKDTMPVNRRSLPSSITMRQARLILSAYGLLAAINESMTNAPEVFKIEWQYASNIERKSPVVYALATSLGLTDKQLDEMFLSAASL